MSRVLLFATAAVVAVSGPALAQQRPDKEVSEVVITGAPYAVTLDSATTSVDILKRDDIDQAPAGGIGDVLSGVAGVRSSAFGPGASRPVIRGLSGPRVLVLSNGLGQVDASALSPDHAVATDPQEAQRIEVLRGPSALAYGGSAIGGVVNIIDNRISSTPVDGVHGRILASGSTVDNGWSTGGQVQYGQGPWVLSVDGLHRESEDYDVPTSPESRRQTAAEGEEWGGKVDSKVENTFTKLSSYGAGLSYVGEQGYIGVSVKRTDTKYGVPGHAHGAEEPTTMITTTTTIMSTRKSRSASTWSRPATICAASTASTSGRSRRSVSPAAMPTTPTPSWRTASRPPPSSPTAGRAASNWSSAMLTAGRAPSVSSF